MAAPAGVTPYAKGVIIELDVQDIVPQKGTSVLGTVVAKGSGVTLYAVNDIVLMDGFNLFSVPGNDYGYAISDEADVLFIYVPI